MRLYLSSFRLGDSHDELKRLASGGRAAVIANAMDGADPDVREEAVQLEIQALTGIGLSPTELDLRDYFTDSGSLPSDLSQFDVLWVRGGNVFVLNHALRQSGADDVIRRGLQDDAYVYAGYSAGPCVLAPTLRGLEQCDDETEVTRLYDAQPIWEGLGVLNFSIVPHVHSPDHPESAVLTDLATQYEKGGVSYVAMRDGQVLIIEDDTVSLV